MLVKDLCQWGIVQPKDFMPVLLWVHPSSSGFVPSLLLGSMAVWSPYLMDTSTVPSAGIDSPEYKCSFTLWKTHSDTSVSEAPMSISVVVNTDIDSKRLQFWGWRDHVQIDLSHQWIPQSSLQCDGQISFQLVEISVGRHVWYGHVFHTPLRMWPTLPQHKQVPVNLDLFLEVSFLHVGGITQCTLSEIWALSCWAISLWFFAAASMRFDGFATSA